MYWCMKILSVIVCAMPESVRHSIGRGIGWLAWLVVPKSRKDLAVQQLMNCGISNNHQEAYHIAKNSVTRFGPMMEEVLYFPRFVKAGLSEKVTFRGRHNLDALLSEGKGAIIATMHGGNWELLGAALAIAGYPILAVTQKQNNHSADTFINEYRQMAKQQVTYKSGVRDMIRHLQDGCAIGLLMDQDPGKNGILATFFGRDTLTASGPAVLARLNNTAVIPIFIHADRPYHHIIDILPPVVPLDTGNKKQDILATTNELNRIIEVRIRQYPEDWFWLHKRWKWTDKLYGNQKG